MDKVLIAVDGSDESLRAVRYVISEGANYPVAEINLINVQIPPPAQVRLEAGLSDETWHAAHQQAGRQVLAPAEKELERAQRRYTSSVAVGEVVHEIVERARALGC